MRTKKVLLQDIMYLSQQENGYGI